MARETPVYDRAVELLAELDRLRLLTLEGNEVAVRHMNVLQPEATAFATLAVAEALRHARDEVRTELRNAAYDVREGLRESVHYVGGYEV